MALPTGSRWTGEPPHATIGVRAGTRIAPQLLYQQQQQQHQQGADVRAKAVNAATGTNRGGFPLQSQQESIAAYGLTERDDGQASLNDGHDDEQAELDELHRRHRANQQGQVDRPSPHEYNTYEAFRTLSPAAQVKAQYTTYDAQQELSRSQPAPLINHPSINHDHLTVGKGRPSTQTDDDDALGSPFVPRSFSADQLPLQQNRVLSPDPTLSRSHPQTSANPPTAQRPRPRKASGDSKSSAHTGVTQRDLIETLATTLESRTAELKALQDTFKVEKAKRRKVEAELSKTRLMMKEYHDASSESDDALLKVSKDLQAVQNVANMMKSNHERSSLQQRSVIERQDATIRSLKEDLDAWKIKANLAAEAAEIDPEVARRALRLLGGEHGWTVENDPARSQFLEEIGRGAVGESLASDAGSRTDRGSGATTPTRWPSVDEGDTRAAQVERQIAQRKAKLDAALRDIERSAFDTDSSRTANVRSPPPTEQVTSPLTLTKNGIIRGGEDATETRPEGKRRGSGVARFVFGVGNRRLSRSNSVGPSSTSLPLASRSRSGSASQDHYSSSTLNIIEATPQTAESKSSSARPGGDTGKLLPPQLRMAQGDGTYGRSASSDIPRAEIPPVFSAVTTNATASRPRKISLTNVLAKGVRAVFPALGPNTSTTHMPESDHVNEKNARWPEEHEVTYATGPF